MWCIWLGWWSTDWRRGVPPHGAWAAKGPPHKWCYCTLRPHAFGPPEEAAGGAGGGEDFQQNSLAL